MIQKMEERVRERVGKRETAREERSTEGGNGSLMRRRGWNFENFRERMKGSEKKIEEVGGCDLENQREVRGR